MTRIITKGTKWEMGNFNHEKYEMTQKRNGVNWEGVLSTNDANYHEKTRKGEWGILTTPRHSTWCGQKARKDTPRHSTWCGQKLNGVNWVLNLRAHYARVNWRY